MSIKIYATSKNVIARCESTKQSSLSNEKRDCFAAFAMTERILRATLYSYRVLRLYNQPAKPASRPARIITPGAGTYVSMTNIRTIGGTLVMA